MTVNDLFEHFNVMPDAIVYFDKPNNIEDQVYIKWINADGEIGYDNDKYNTFIDEYGDREVVDWKYYYPDTIHLKLR